MVTEQTVHESFGLGPYKWLILTVTIWLHFQVVYNKIIPTIPITPIIEEAQTKISKKVQQVYVVVVIVLNSHHHNIVQNNPF